jgi:exopolysaccharide production protein ExoQ
MAGYVSSYPIAAILVFFAMSGMLPSRYSAASSLQGMISDSTTVLGMGFQALFWLTAMVWMSRHAGVILDSCRRMKVVMALSLLAPLSAVWSQNPSNSLRRGAFLVLGTLFAFGLVRSYGAQQLAELLVMAGVTSGVLGIVVSVVLPQLGLDAGNGNAWQGIFHSKNGCAQVMLFFLTAAISFKFRSRTMSVLRYLLFVVAFVMIVMANAKTAWILTPAYILLIVVATKLKRFARRDATILAVACVSGVVVLAVLVPIVLPLVLPFLGKDSSLSGRLPLWGAAFLSMMKRPLLGYGFASFWTGLQGESLNIFMSTQFEIHQAQNGLLELGLQLGLVGIGLVVLSLVRAFRDAMVCFQYAHSDVVNWYVGLLALTISYNVDEAFFARENFLPWLLYLVACTGLAEEAQKAAAARSSMELPFTEMVRRIEPLAEAA